MMDSDAIEADIAVVWRMSNPKFSALCSDLADKAGLIAGASVGVHDLPEDDILNLRQAFASIQLVLVSQGYRLVEIEEREEQAA